MNELNNDLFLVEEEENFDFRKFLNKILYRWWWFAISVPLCLGGAIYYYMSRVPVYNVETKVMINDSRKGELGTNAMMKELGFFQGDVFVENEMIELRSKNLMREVVKELDLNVRYFEEGGIREKEFYKNAPFRILIDYPENIRDTSFYVSIGKDDRVEVLTPEGESVFKGNYSERITVGGYSISIEKEPANVKEGEYRVSINSFPVATDVFYGKLDISNLEKNTNAVGLSVKDELPPRAIDLIYRLIAAYNDNGVSNKRIVSTNTVDFINSRLEVINQELSEIEDRAENFKKQNRLTDLASDATFIMERKKSAGAELLKLETDLDVMRSVRDFLDQKAGFHLLPENLGLADVALNNGIGKYNEMILRRNKLLQTARESNPLIKGIESQLRGLKENIRMAIENVEKGLEIKIQSLEKESQLVDKKLTSVPTQEKQYREISRQQGLKENLFLFLMQKREEAEIAKLMYVPMAKIIEDPNTQGSPVSPKKSMILLIGLVLGVALPFGGIFLLDVLDSKVRDTEDVEKAVNAPVLGSTPELPEGERDVFQENFMMSESMHLIRENLNYMVRQAECPVIMVTSTIPQEGKSLVSAHLANAYAKSGKKTIAIGCDLRNPKMYLYFKCDHHKGLSAYLAGMENDKKNIINKIDDCLYAIFGGSVPPNPTQLIASPRMEELITELKEEFDCIVLDTPPLGILAEGFTLSRLADACVYVVRAHLLDRKDLRLVTDLEKKKRLPNLGIVVNGIKIRRGGYGYGYGYGYGAKYGYGYGQNTKRDED